MKYGESFLDTKMFVLYNILKVRNKKKEKKMKQKYTKPKRLKK